MPNNSYSTNYTNSSSTHTPPITTHLPLKSHQLCQLIKWLYKKLNMSTALCVFSCTPVSFPSKILTKKPIPLPNPLVSSSRTIPRVWSDLFYFWCSTQFWQTHGIAWALGSEMMIAMHLVLPMKRYFGSTLAKIQDSTISLMKPCLVISYWLVSWL